MQQAIEKDTMIACKGVNSLPAYYLLPCSLPIACCQLPIDQKDLRLHAVKNRMANRAILPFKSEISNLKSTIECL